MKFFFVSHDEVQDFEKFIKGLNRQDSNCPTSAAQEVSIITKNEHNVDLD